MKRIPGQWLQAWRHLHIGIAAVAILVFGMTTAGSALAQDDWDDWDEDDTVPVEIHGFVEFGGGGRIVHDRTQSKDLLINEARFRLDMAHYRDRAELYFKGDFVADGVVDDTSIDIRRAAVLLRAASWLDVVAGRQVLTWGTGDLLFLNDRFPKDFVSFFVGRNDEFLKAPSNSLKATLYSSAANLDVVWTPNFTPDTYITGERLSFYSPFKPGRTSASEMGAPLDADLPPETWENSEFAGRIFKNTAGIELAAYGYAGFWNQPTATDMNTMKPAFAELAVYGASMRGNVLGGIGNVEGAYYDSYEDRDGADPAIPNSQARGVAGYEREIASDVTAGLQYYAEWTQNHDSLSANAFAPEFVPEEVRHMVTLRLNQRLMQQTLTVSLFGYYSPNENDGYIRPVVTRDWSDSVTLTVGGNVFWGDESTFFGQLRDNTNLYVRARYSF
jgi:hypothetical protein